jgi:DNA polymerase-3 subunit delta'
MTLPPLYGHDALRLRLEAAFKSGRFPQAALLVGPPGAGKQRVALWVAQALLCEGSGPRPCGTCPACRMALELTHPDIHWIVPVPRPKSSDASKQVDEAREAIGAVIAERRRARWYQPPDGLASHSLASVRAVLQIVSLTPFRGRRKVIVLGDAERLVVQEASLEAANALLKALEEPPADTTIILTATEPRVLLPTIRSRVVPIRVGPVGDAAVRDFLSREVAPPPTGAALERRVAASRGLIGRALWAGDGGSDAASGRAGALLGGLRRGPAFWAEAALSQPPWGARGDFGALLDGMAEQIRVSLAEDAARRDADGVGRRLVALRLLEEARDGISTNANPQLALAVLARGLERVA